MRIVVQRVGRASVLVSGVLYGRIGKGLMVLVGIEHGDEEEDVEWLV